MGAYQDYGNRKSFSGNFCLPPAKQFLAIVVPSPEISISCLKVCPVALVRRLFLARFPVWLQGSRPPPVRKRVVLFSWCQPALSVPLIPLPRRQYLTLSQFFPACLLTPFRPFYTCFRIVRPVIPEHRPPSSSHCAQIIS